MFVKHLTLFTFPEFINITLRIVQALLLARILTPDLLGMSNAVALIFLYAQFLQCGVFDGVSLRLFSFSNEQLHDEKIPHQYYSSALNFAVCGLLISSLLTITATLPFRSISLSNSLNLGIVTTVIALFFYYIYIYSLVWLRWKKRFNSHSVVEIISLLIRTSSTLLLTWFYGINGFFIAFMGSWIVSALISSLFSKILPKPSLDVNITKELMRLGLPVVFIGSLMILFTTIDRWFILKFLSISDMGYYSIVGTAISLMLIVPIKTSSLLMQYTIQHHNETVHVQQFGQTYCTILAISAISLFFMALVVKESSFYILYTFLPLYQASYSLMTQTVLIALFLSFFYILNAAFIVMNKKRLSIIALALAIVLELVLCMGVIAFVPTLYALSIATAFASFILSVLMLFYFTKHASIPKGLFRIFIFTFAYLTTIFLLGEYFFPHQFNLSLKTNLITSLYKHLIYGSFFMPVFIVFAKKGIFKKLLNPINRFP